MSLLESLAQHPPLSETDARALTDDIAKTGRILWSQITRAYFGRAWSALGYESWDEYCDQELDGARIKMPREERQMTIGSLRDAGMSIRAIAAATGVDAKTVQTDIQAGVGNSHTSDDEVIDAEIIDAGEITHQPKVTGIDGKSYPSSRPTGGNRVDSVRELAKLGLTAEQIAQDIGISSTRVTAIARTNKIKLPGSVLDRDEKAERARQMAAEGYTSAQIGAAIGISQMAHFRDRHGIDVPADAVVGRARNLDSTRIVSATVAQVDGIGLLLDQVSYDALDPEDVKGWLPVLDDAIRSLTTLRTELRKVSQP